MPKKKRSRRHRKHNINWNVPRKSNNNAPNNSYDDLRIQATNSSPINTSSLPGLSDVERTYTRTHSPVLLEATRNKSAKSSEIIQRRSLSRDSSLSYSGIKLVFNSSNNSVKESISNPFLRIEQQTTKNIRSNSSMAKFHSPELEKLPFKTTTSTQTPEQLHKSAAIMDTPKINQDASFDVDYEIISLKSSPIVSGYNTPVNRVRRNSDTSHNNMATCIQDLNNLHKQVATPETLNCSKVLKEANLRKLQNFNELILNTSQSIDYENCELPQEVEAVVPVVEIEIPANELSGTEISFFTPQLYNVKSASTPIESEHPESEQGEVNKRFCTSVATQVNFISKRLQNIATQTSDSKLTLTPSRILTLNKRRTYRSLTPSFSYRISPKLQMSCDLILQKKTKMLEATKDVGTFSTFITEIRKYHENYSSKVSMKIVDICCWLGQITKKGLTSFHKFYSLLRGSVDVSTCPKCSDQLAALKDSLEKLSTSIEEQNSKIQQELREIKEYLSKSSIPRITSSIPPPPPPLPPPPLLLHSTTNNLKSKITAKKKANENTRPIISLEDILKVKLRKTGERPSSSIRRSTDSLVASDILKRARLRPASSKPHQTPSSIQSLSTNSSTSNSPRSSLSRLLMMDVNTNVRRTRSKLKRSDAYNFDILSRRSLLSSEPDKENYSPDFKQ